MYVHIMHMYICTIYKCNTVEPLYYRHFGTLILVLITEVSSIQRSSSTPQYYTGTQNGVLITEVSSIQRFVIERFHCIYFNVYSNILYIKVPAYSNIL